MANRERGTVTIAAGGKDYLLQFTTNAMCELEDATGKSITAVVAELSDEANPPGMKLLRTLLWAGLTEHQAGIDIKDAGAICDDIGMDKLGGVIGDALQAAFPEQDGKSGKAKASKAG